MRLRWCETMWITSFCVVCSSGSALEISASWSVSAAWSVVPQSLILSITAVCWAWTRFRIKLLCTLSCYRPTSGPTRLLLFTRVLLLLGESFSQCYVNTSDEKHFCTLKEVTFCFFLTPSNVVSSELSMSMIWLLIHWQVYCVSDFICSFWSDDDDDGDVYIYQQLQYHAGLASSLLNQQSLKRSVNQMGASAKRRPKLQPSTLVLPPQWVLQEYTHCGDLHLTHQSKQSQRRPHHQLHPDE